MSAASSDVRALIRRPPVRHSTADGDSDDEAAGDRVFRPDYVAPLPVKTALATTPTDDLKPANGAVETSRPPMSEQIAGRRLTSARASHV